MPRFLIHRIVSYRVFQFHFPLSHVAATSVLPSRRHGVHVPFAALTVEAQRHLKRYFTVSPIRFRVSNFYFVCSWSLFDLVEKLNMMKLENLEEKQITNLEEQIMPMDRTEMDEIWNMILGVCKI
jgi:hypothetical protein